MKKILIAVFALSMGLTTVNAQTSKATTAAKPAVQQSTKPAASSKSTAPAKSAAPQKEVAPSKASKPVQPKADVPAKSKLPTVSPVTKTKKEKTAERRVNDKKNMKQAPKLKGTKSAVPQQKQAKKD
jgi:hypothetical protein